MAKVTERSSPKTLSANSCCQKHIPVSAGRARNDRHAKCHFNHSKAISGILLHSYTKLPAPVMSIVNIVEEDTNKVFQSHLRNKNMEKKRNERKNGDADNSNEANSTNGPDNLNEPSISNGVNNPNEANSSNVANNSKDPNSSDGANKTNN